MANSRAVTQSRREAAPWPKVRLGEICDSISDGDHLPPPKSNEGIPFITISDIGKEGEIDFSNCYHVPCRYYDKIDEKRKPRQGDILYTVVGSFGKAKLVGNEREFCFQRHIAILRPNYRKIDSHYLYSQMRSQAFFAQADAFAVGVAQRTISLSALRRMTIPLPSLPVQRAIAGRLSAYDHLIENNRRRIAILERKAEQLYKEWFLRRRLSCLAAATSAALPLGDVIEISRGLSYTSSEIDTDAGVQLINLKNIQPYGGFRYDGSKRFSGKYKPDQIVVRGDLVMGVTDMTQDRRAVGSVALMPPLKETSVISADLIKIEPKIDKLFLYAMFRYGGLSRYISQFANGANVLHLRPQSIMGIKVQVPSKEAMERLSARLRPMIALMDNLNEQNALLSQQRDLLLPRLMSGKQGVRA